MSSADSRPPEIPTDVSTDSTDASAAADSNRPALKQPPRRPVRPVPVEEPPAAPPPVAEVESSAPPTTVAPESEKEEVVEPVAQDVVSEPSEEISTDEEETTPQPRLRPIAPPSEPMQYRAIGLLKGKYQPSEETFNRGSILNHDGSVTAAVLLGRTTSLVKKHLDLEKEHLWVVYPRTVFQDDIGIAVQIVGVWEPETLGDEEEDTPETPEDAVQPDYFSIRGEVIKYDERKQEVTISIVQKMRTGKQPKRPFKLVINGSIGVKTIGYFWDMEVRREGNQFILIDGSYVAAVPPKKRSKKRPGGPGGGPSGGKRRPFKRSGPPRPKTNVDKDAGNDDGAKDEKPSVVQVGDGAPVMTDAAGE